MTRGGQVSLSSRVTVRPDILSRALGDDVVLLDLHRGLYYSLDVVGARLWHLLVGQGSLPAVRDALLEDYDVSEARCVDDLLDLIATMRDKGLVDVA